MKKTTTYTITELRDLIGGAAFEAALRQIRECTGLDDPEDLMTEAETYRLLFTKSGRMITK